MLRNTALALAFVDAAAVHLLDEKMSGFRAPWTAHRVAERVTHTHVGEIREQDISVNVSPKMAKIITLQCGNVL